MAGVHEQGRWKEVLLQQHHEADDMDEARRAV
jgi:hypothetical protein